jgi:N-methylhydantoinase A/oxoprolinase/acetone carboxylase beta subunit
VRIGADSGGTFTDIVGTDGRVLKIPSTSDDPGRAVLDGVAGLVVDGDPCQLLAHGTTVATNALLERRGARVTLVTTKGFADVIEIARQHRPSLYDPWADRPAPLVDRRHRVEVDERVAADGAVLVALDASAAPALPEDTEAVAVCLLHADLHPHHEAELGEQLRTAGHDVSTSHEVAPEFREYERTVTTVLNAYLRPVCGPYLRGLAQAAQQVAVMASSGGLVDLDTAAELPAALLLSGPAAGVRAAAAVATACGYPDALSFDMGGTSTDVALVLGGEPAPAAQRQVAGFPVRLPTLDVHTIGAGGGSIASLDAGGALVVGPESAGATPGPACYGKGGSLPTVTDANLALGRLPDDAAFPGLGVLDRAAALDALAAAGVDAAGVIDVVNVGMEQALRVVSVERGVDPAGLALVAFGGAGPLHACDLADALGIPTVLVPAAAGVLSAVGLLTSPRRRELVRSWPTPRDHEGLEAALTQLADEAAAALRREESAEGSAASTTEAPVLTTAVDCRYAGQSHELQVAAVEDFPAEHRRRNGYDRPGDPIEVTALRAVAELPAPARIEELLGGWAGRWSEPVVGPQVIVREECTIWVPEGWTGAEGPLGTLVLTRTGSMS